MRRLIPLLAVFVTCAALGAQQAPVAPGAPGGQPAKASVSGTVVRSTTADPIAKAAITLVRVAPQGARGLAPQAPAGAPQQAQAQAQQQQQPLSFTATTDELGRFQIKDVDQGSYRVVAARNGFARQEYGQTSFNRPSTVLNIRAGQQVTDIAFRLTPAATVSGRVLDSTGEPLPGITVQALRSTYDATGKRTMQAVGSGRTNDLGEYRIYWINPGRYFISANAARSFGDLIAASASQAVNQGANQAQAQQAQQAAALFGSTANTNEVVDPGYGLTYYPGSTDASRAVAIELQPGSEVRGVDFNLIRTQRVQITGRVVDTTTGRPPQNANVSVSPRDGSGSPLDALLGIDPTGANRYNSQTGEFVVANVAPGSYWLQVISQGQNTAQPPAGGPANTAEALAVLSSINSARIPIDVLGADINNVTLNVSPGVTINGHLRIDGSQPANATDLQRITVQLQSTSGGASILSLLQGGGVRPAADGSFSIPRVSAGEYKLVVNGLGTNLYLKEARLAQMDALDGVVISETVDGTLEIVLRTNPGQVTGNVLDATRKPIPGVQAVLIPEQRQRQDLFKTATTDAEGRFTFRGITPGDYRIYAWEDLEPFAYFDPAVVKEFEAVGRLVHIQESSNESVELRLIPARRD